jgi:5-methylthioribose kinase
MRKRKEKRRNKHARMYLYICIVDHLNIFQEREKQVWNYRKKRKERIFVNIKEDK